MKQSEKKRQTYNFIQGLIWLALGAFLLTGAWAVRVQARLAGQVVRLHVLAASDSEEDQARKLRVRDAVLTYTEGCLSGAESREAAAARLQVQLPEITRRAEAVLRAEGCADAVGVELAETDFPTRVYGGGAESGYTGGADRNGTGVGNPGGVSGGFALPAGKYLALRVVIGPGAGRNWWCVVFPPLCGGTKKTAEPPSLEKPSVPEKPTIPERETTVPARREEHAAEQKTVPAEQEERAVPKVREEKAKPAETVTAHVQETARASPPAAPVVSTVRNLPTAAQRYEVRFRVVELWGRLRAALS